MRLSWDCYVDVADAESLLVHPHFLRIFPSHVPDLKVVGLGARNPRLKGLVHGLGYYQVSR